jgi:hypothetical protein
VTDSHPHDRKSGELEEEIDKLKRQLSVYEGSTVLDSASAPGTRPTAPYNLESNNTQSGDSMNERSRHSLDPVDRILTTTVPGGVSPDSLDQSGLPGTTTIPSGTIPNSTAFRVREATSSRKLRDIELSKDEINELFQVYVLHGLPGLNFEF